MRTVLATAALVFLFSAGVAPCEDSAPSDPARTGHFQLTSTLAELAGADSADAVEAVISPDEPVTWEVYVPAAYRSDEPPGLMVYISPSPSGRIPRGWESVMDKRHLIWIGANGSGNRVTAARRALFALVAPALAGKHYRVDRDRIFLSGLSGGGRMAGMVAADYPHLFKGAIYSCGVNALDQHPPKRLEQFKENRYVFVTGTRDHALEQTKRVHRQYLESGIQNAKLMVIRNMSHRNPESWDFDTAVQYLDSGRHKR